MKPMKDAFGSASLMLRASRPACVRCASSEMTMMSSRLAIRLFWVDIPVELVIKLRRSGGFIQSLLQIVARCGPRCLVVGDAAADEGLVDLAVEVVSVGHQQEGEVAFQLPPHLLGKERHGIGTCRCPGCARKPRAGRDRMRTARQCLLGPRVCKATPSRRPSQVPGKYSTGAAGFEWQFYEAMP